MPSIAVNRAVGRPSKYSEELLAHAQGYLERYSKMQAKHPYIEELALEMRVNDDTIYEWAKATNDDGSLKYPEFSVTIKDIKTLQRLRLLQKTLYQFPAGAIFQLKANHGMMESEKKIIAGDKDEPFEIKFTDERKVPREE